MINQEMHDVPETAKKRVLSRDPRKVALEELQAKESQLVRGKFVFHEVPGGMVSFSFRKYKGEKIVNYTMYDGQVYTVPLAVARHLNNNTWYPEYEHMQGERGTMAGVNPDSHWGLRIGRKVHRMSFQSLDFMDIEDQQAPTLYTASY